MAPLPIPPIPPKPCAQLLLPCSPNPQPARAEPLSAVHPAASLSLAGSPSNCAASPRAMLPVFCLSSWGTQHQDLPACGHCGLGVLLGPALTGLVQTHPHPHHVWLQASSEPPANLMVPIFPLITQDAGTLGRSKCCTQMLGP